MVSNINDLAAFAEQDILAFTLYDRGRYCLLHIDDDLVEELLFDMYGLDIGELLPDVAFPGRGIAQEEVFALLYHRSADDLVAWIAGIACHLDGFYLEEHRKRQQQSYRNDNDQCQRTEQEPFQPPPIRTDRRFSGRRRCRIVQRTFTGCFLQIVFGIRIKAVRVVAVTVIGIAL